MAAEDGSSPPRGRHRHSAPNEILAPPWPGTNGPAKPEPGPSGAEPAKQEHARPDFSPFEPWTLEPEGREQVKPQHARPDSGAFEQRKPEPRKPTPAKPDFDVFRPAKHEIGRAHV